MKTIGTTLFLAAWIAFSFSAFGQESVMLKYGMKAGTAFQQEMEITQNTVQSMMGQEIKVVGQIKALNEMKVEAVSPEGNATILMTVMDLSISQSAMGKDTTMRFEGMKDAVRGVYSPEGKMISSVKVDSSKAAAVINQLEPGRLRMLPGKQVKVGETWSESYTETKKAASGTPFGLDMDIANEYTLASKEIRDGKEVYKITSTGTIAVTGKGNQMGMEMFVEGNAKVQGYSLFDPARKMIVYTEDDTEMELSIAVSGPQNMTIPMTQSIKTISRIR